MQTTEELPVESTASAMPKIEAVGPFSAEQLAAAKQAYDGLHALFGTRVTVNNVGTPQGLDVTGDHKTIGDVGDKALDLLRDGASKTLDLLGQGAAQIVATTEKAAPVIWKIMVKQQIANALANIIGPLVLLFGAWIFHLIISAAYGNQVAGSDLAAWKAGLGLFAPIVVAIIGTIWLIDALTASLQQLVNPQYFAARDLIYMITRHRRN